MRAKFAGTCAPCGAAIEPGQVISIFMSTWAHEDCKKATIAHRQKAAGAPIELAPAEDVDGPKEYVGQRTAKRRNLKAFKATRSR